MVMGCKLCAKGIGFGEGMTQREMAQRYGIESKSSVGRHRAHLARAGKKHAPQADNSVSVSLPDGFILQRASIRDPETGSWYRTERERDTALLDMSDIERMFDRPVVLPPSGGNPVAEVLAASDLQIGKAKQKGGGTPETLASARRSLKRFALRCEQTKPEEILIGDGGDVIENIFNVSSQLATNDLDVPAQVRTARRFFAEALHLLAPLAPRVVLLGVPSNHGAARAGFKSDPGTPDADWGLDINLALEEQFSGREGFQHVEFVRPDAGEETAVVDVAGTRLAWNHGNRSAGLHKHGDWWAKQDHGRRPGWDADILVMSHYHTFGVWHSGNSRWIIGASSSDPGSDWFTLQTGEAARRGMTAFTVEGGDWSNVEIL